MPQQAIDLVLVAPPLSDADIRELKRRLEQLHSTMQGGSHVPCKPHGN